MDFFSQKRNVVISAIIALLFVLVIIMSIVINCKTADLEKANDKLKAANGTIDKYSAQIEEYKQSNDQMQSQIDSITAENESLKQQMTELAAKKSAAASSGQAQPVVNPAPNPITDEEYNKKIERTNNLIISMSLPRVTQKPSKPKVCYLTFDDGPSNVTPFILDILRRYNVKATFFVIGNGKLDLLPEIAASGHTIGLHSNTHIYSGIYTSIESYLLDLRELSKKVEAKTGIKSNVVRFPGGSSNTVSQKYCPGLMTILSGLLPDMGYSYFDWNVVSGDADKSKMPAEIIAGNVINRCANKDSVCVLMHDAPSKITTAEALPVIIENLSGMGFTFEPLTASTFGYHQAVNN